MYIYFNKRGEVEEIVSGLPARFGSIGVNTFYVYFDWETQPTAIDYAIRWSDGSTTSTFNLSTPSSFVFSKSLTALGRDRDTKKFIDGALYSPAFVFTLPTSIPASGDTTMTIRAIEGTDKTMATAIIHFNVEEGLISGDADDVTQVEALENLIAELPFPSPQIIDGNPGDEGIDVDEKTGMVVINKNTWEVFDYADGSWVSKGTIKGRDGRAIRTAPSTQLEAGGEYDLSVLSNPDNGEILVGDNVLGNNGMLFSIVSIADGKFTLGDTGIALKGDKGDKGDTGPQAAIPTFHIDDNGHLICVKEDLDGLTFSIVGRHLWLSYAEGDK